MKNYNPPESLYRFLPDFTSDTAPEYARDNFENLLNGKLRLTGKDQVNDPFEFNPSREFNANTSDIYNEFKLIYLGRHPSPLMNEMRDELRSRYTSLSKLKKDSSKFLRSLKSNFLKRGSYQNLGFVSWTTEVSNLLMWSHYASNHSGFVIELEFGPQSVSCPFAFQPVTYQKKRPIEIYEKFLASSKSPELLRAQSKILFTKSIEWEYEKEWRMFGIIVGHDRTLSPGEYLNVDPELYLSIYFGVNSSNALIDEVSKLLNEKNLSIKCYRATLDSSEYIVNFDDL